jgi:hypothetical protein
MYAKKKVSFSDLAFTPERTLSCDHVDLPQLREGEALCVLHGLL